MDSYSYSNRSARSGPNRESEYMRNQRAEYQRLPNSRSPSPFTPRRPIPRPEPRPELRSRSRPRESWYHEVPILGSVLRTMKDILGLYDYDYDYGYDNPSTGYDSRRSGKYHRYHYRNIENSRRRSYAPIDEEYYRGRRNSTTQTRYDGNRSSRRYHSPSPTDRSGNRNEHKRYSYSDSRTHNHNRKMHPREPVTEYIYPSVYPSVRRRSSSISSYTRSRPQIVTRSPAPPPRPPPPAPPPSTTPSKRKVKFASPLPSAFKSFKRASIDDQSGSRKRGSSSNPNSNTSTVRTPRPRSPVQERKPLRAGRRVSFSTGPSIIRSRSNGYEYEYGHRYGYEYGYSYPKTPIPPTSTSTSTSTRYYASRSDPSISIVEAGNRVLDDRGFGVLGQAGTRGSLRHQNIFEVCGDLPPAELEG